MWLSERLRRASSAAAGEAGVVSIEGTPTAVLTGAEERAAAVLAPGGYEWRPRQGETVLVLRGGALGEERYLAGRVQTESALAPGEVRIASSGGAAITLRNDGRVELSGAVTVNGAPLAPEEAEHGA